MNRPRIVVLLSKDPTTTRSGDMEMNLLLLEHARAVGDVTVICLADDPDLPATPGLVRVAKAPVRAADLARRSLTRGRSLVFTRFDSDELLDAIEAAEADLYVAVHLYMAETFLRSRRAGGPAPLLVTAVVSEAMVWSSTRGLLGRLQRPLIRRDERRVVRAAAAVGAYDVGEAEQASRDGARSAVWLPLTTPPAPPVDVASTPPRLVLMGDRTWSPNAEACDLVLAWWPRISAGIEDAELVLVGKPAGPPRALPSGVRDLGFVDDLEATLAGCRAMVAPILTGGGVRVKILAAASRGLPVVATGVAIGSLDAVFPIEAHDGADDFIAAARHLLLDAAAAAAQGRALHEANAALHATGTAREVVRRWLRSALPDTADGSAGGER